MFIHPADSSLEEKTLKLMFPLATISSDEFKDLYQDLSTLKMSLSDISMPDNIGDVNFSSFKQLRNVSSKSQWTARYWTKACHAYTTVASLCPNPK